MRLFPLLNTSLRSFGAACLLISNVGQAQSISSPEHERNQSPNNMEVEDFLFEESSEESFANNFEIKALQLVNAERQSRGLKPLRLSSALKNAAQKHADDMATRNYFAHDTPPPKRRTFRDRIIAAGYPSGAMMAENISAGHKTIGGAFQGWMESNGHRTNILNPKYTEMGIGFQYSDSSEWKNYWVQTFGSGS